MQHLLLSIHLNMMHISTRILLHPYFICIQLLRFGQNTYFVWRMHLMHRLQHMDCTIALCTLANNSRSAETRWDPACLKRVDHSRIPQVTGALKNTKDSLYFKMRKARN